MIVTLIPRPDHSPVPRVEISFTEEVTIDGGGVTPSTDLVDGGGPAPEGAVFSGGVPMLSTVEVPVGTDTVTIWWRSQGWSGRVSGLIRRAFTGPAGFVDLEAGFNVPTTYEVEFLNGHTPLGRATIGSTLLPWEGDENGVLIQQPMDPSLNVTVVNLSGSWPSITRGVSSSLVRPENESLPRVISSGPRQGLSSVPIDFAVSSEADSVRLWETLGTAERPQLPVWLIRAHDGIIPRRLFVHVGDLTQVDFDYRDGGEWSQFQATVDEVARPAPGLIISPLSYTDLDVSFASYTEMDAAFPSYSARDSAWEYAGASGGS